MLWLDFLAIKANQLSWLQEIGNAFDLGYLPGLAYNRALAVRMEEGKEVRLDLLTQRRVELIS